MVKTSVAVWNRRSRNVEAILALVRSKGEGFTYNFETHFDQEEQIINLIG